MSTSSKVTSESPCCRVCKLDAAERYCLGCFRTREDIGAWSRATDAEKIAMNEKALELAATVRATLKKQA